MTRFRKAMCYAFVCLCFSPSYAGQDVRNILVVNSFHIDMPWQKGFDQGFRQGFSGHEGFMLFFEYLDSGRFNNDGSTEFFRYLEEKYHATNIDYLITESSSAASLISRHPDFHSEARRLYINSNMDDIATGQAKAPHLAFSVSADFSSTILEMQRLVKPRHLFVIADTKSAGGRRRLASFKSGLQASGASFKTEYLLDLSIGELKEKVASLPENSAIFYLLVFEDGAGEKFIPYDAARQIADSANAPIFSKWDTLLGSGVIGGEVLSSAALGEDVARFVIDSSKGKKVALSPSAGIRLIYDWRQLKRFNIDEALLGNDAELKFYEPTFWSIYWPQIIFGLFFVVFLMAYSLQISRLHYRSRVQSQELSSALQKLKQSQEKYRLAMDAVRDGFWDWNCSTGSVEYSPGWMKILGMNTVEDNYNFWESHIHEDDRDDVLNSLQQHIEGKAAYWSREHRLKTHDGNWKWVLGRGQVIDRNSSGKALRMVGTLTDISERKKVEYELGYQATHDALTLLINRNEFERRADTLVKNLRVHSGEHVLCFLDLDRFKIVNDACGHPAGDDLLRQLSGLLRHLVRKNDTLARLGGDEFALLMEHCSLDQAHRVAQKILEKVQDFQFNWQGKLYRVGISIGLASITDEVKSFDEVLKQADAACHMAKERGRNRIQVFDLEDESITQRQGDMQWVSRINQALEEDWLRLYAQPIVALSGSTHSHCEILLRMLNEDGEILPPGGFLSAAERYNLMELLDAWVIRNTFQILAANRQFLQRVDFVSINLSAASLVNPGFLDFISSQFHEQDIEAGKICFEITETAAISNIAIAIAFITHLREMGCRFALDDFGSGLASFGYLKQLPVDFVKIDGMFVRDIVDDPIDFAMVKTINEIGHIMGKQTIAEFVENAEISSMLESIGVDYVQGYGLGMPVPIEQMLKSGSKS